MKENQTPARARLGAFFDVGTFVELGAYIRRPGTKDAEEGVVCGYGALGGRLVFAFAQDSTKMKGALDARHAEKIAMLYEKATAVGAPVVGMFDCAGALVFDGAAALGGYGLLLRTVSAASGVIPQIAVITGTCAGTMAAVAALFDFTVVVEGCKLYVNSPFLTDGENGSAAYAYENGTAALLAADESDAFAKVRGLVNYLPDHAGQGGLLCDTNDDASRLVALGDTATAAEALGAVTDNGLFLELYGGICNTVKVGLAGVGGLSAMLVAIDGALDAAAAIKMTKAIQLADSFDLPTVTLVNCEGVAVAEKEDPRIANALAALAAAVAESEAPIVSAIVGKAIGAGFILTGSRSLGTDVVYALPGAEIAAMSAEAGVAFLMNDQISAKKSRADLEKQWREENASAEEAAACGEVDDIVAPAELRARIAAALYMLAGDSEG